MGVLNYSRCLRRNLQALDAPLKTYALAQSRGRMTIKDIAKHMANHNSPYSAGVIEGVLTDATSCFHELVTDGWILDLNDFGTLACVLKSRGVCESEPDPKTGVKPVFTASDITGVYLKMTPGLVFRKLREQVTLHEVLTLKEVREANKAKQLQYANGVETETETETDEEGE